MKMRRLLSVITSAVMAITSVSLTAFFTSADDTLNYNSKWDFIAKSISRVLDIDKPIVGSGYYSYIDNYDVYKKLESKKLVSGYDKSFFDENMLIVNWLLSFSGDRGDYENPEIIKGEAGVLTFNYVYNMSYITLDWIAYDINFIEFKKSDVNDIDFSDITVNVTKTYSNAEPLYGPDGELWSPDPSTIPDENVTLEMINILDYIKTTSASTTSSTTTTKNNNAKPNIDDAIKQAKIKNLTAKSKAKKKITVNWTKVNGAKGYQVQVAKSKKFKNVILKKLTTKKKITIKNSKIKSNKTYYVRVRAYTEYDGKKVYSKWGKNVKKVKIK